MDFFQGMSEMTVFELSGRIALIVAAVSFVIQITPIKINPWSWIARKIGKAVNHDLSDQVKSVGDEVKKLQKTVSENDAKRDRESILEFGDELIYNPERRHSKDRFDNVMQHIREYNAYCAEHPDFKNNMTETTTKLILTTYEKCMTEHSFL